MTLTPSLGFIVPAGTAFLVTAFATPLMARFARGVGLVATPKDDRWHTGQIPLLGGVAVAAGAVISALVWGFVRSGMPLAALLAGVIMFAVGLADDVIGMKPATKLTAQIAVACFVVSIVQTPHWVGLLAVDTILTILWIVGITNALNLLDNMDGLCAGIAAIAATALYLTLGGDVTAARSLAATVAGAAAGSLLFNFQPARIFMGDGGSLFLGATLAVLALSTDRTFGKNGVLSSMAVPVLLLIIPIFDTTFVTVARKLSSRAASTGGRDHTSHRLVALGFSERQAVLMCYALAGVSAATAVLLGRVALPEANILMALVVVTLLLLAVRLGRVKVYDGQDYALLRTPRYTPLVIQLMYKRRIFEVLLDLCLVTIAYYAAYVIRFDTGFSLYYRQFEQSLPIVIASELLMFFVVGIYRGVWRYMGLSDLTTFAKAVAGGTLVSIMGVVYIYRFEGYSRGVFIINAMALTLLLIGSRVSFRVIGELAARHSVKGRRAIIYGAGDGAVLLIRELRNNPNHDYRVVGLIDDDPAKQQRRILGVPVVGPLEQLPDAIGRLQPDAVIVSTLKLPSERRAALQRVCFRSGTELLQLDFKLQVLPNPQPSAPGL